MPGIGLVLGAGGVVGHAFHAGVLAAVSEATGWDPREADVIVGTSAGSVVGALLRAGASAPDLAARATGAPVSAAGQRLIARAAEAQADLPAIPARAERRLGRRAVAMSAPGALVRAARQPWNARPGALAAAMLPEGRIPTELVAAGLRPLFTEWPEAALWINAVQLDTGRRVTFGRDLSEGPTPVAVADAVAASCAIPAFFAPVLINGTRYVDGGVHSPTNAELVAGIGLDLVIVSSPMSIAGNGLRVAPDQPGRRLARFALSREIARVRRSGTAVLTFQPTHADVGVMGFNAMDESHRAPVARIAHASALERLARPDAADRIAVLRESVSSRTA